jgi:hypothetical protein
MNKSGTRVVTLLGAALVIILSVFFSSIDAKAQDVNAKISQAIKNASTSELSKHFNTSIDLTIPGSEGTYSKVQAEQILKSFFTKYSPQSFAINHKGNSNDGSMYAIGTYKSSGKTFRTYFLVKPIDGQMLIHQLKFESKED